MTCANRCCKYLFCKVVVEVKGRLRKTFMSNTSKFTWPCRSETPDEKRFRLEWLAQQLPSKDELNQVQESKPQLR